MDVTNSFPEQPLGCPNCGSISFDQKDDIIKCSTCKWAGQFKDLAQTTYKHFLPLEVMPENFEKNLRENVDNTVKQILINETDKVYLEYIIKPYLTLQGQLNTVVEPKNLFTGLILKGFKIN